MSAEKGPLWEKDDRSDYEKYTSIEELQDMLAESLVEANEANRKIGILFSVVVEKDDLFTTGYDYEGTLLGVEKSEEPFMVVGDVTCSMMRDPQKQEEDVFIEHLDTMRVPLSAIGSAVPYSDPA